jgi:hypothetical protein
MRFHYGAIPSSPDFTPDDTWKSIREPSPWLMQLIALPIGVVTAAGAALLWLFLTPMGEAKPAAFIDALAALTPAAFLAALAGIIVVHELIHAVVHPQAGRSSHSILGFWPSRVLFYAHFDGELSRNRFIGILLMPLLVISILPLLVAACIQIPCGWMAFISSSNALLACGDVFGAGMVLYQIPATAIVRNQGWRTFWREPAALAA